MKITKYITIIIILILFGTLSAEVAPKGSLVIIGGGLSSNNHAVFNTFIELGGGKENIRLAIIPAASMTPIQSGESHARDFISHGIPKEHIKIFPIAVLDDPSTTDIDESKWSDNGKNLQLAEEIHQYNSVFFVGGDQDRYRQVFIDSKGKDYPVLAAIREVYRNGGVIGGTSAGAAIMSDPMLISGNPTETILSGVVYEFPPSGPDPEKQTRLTKGLGFFTPGIVDQHFIKRGRIGRLIPTLLYTQKQKICSLGFGIDEDTALVYKDKTATVVGSSGVIIIDTENAEVMETNSGPKIRNITLHYLENGDSFNTETGKFTIDPVRKKIEKGKEYYDNNSLDTNILGKDAVKELITTGLIDCKQQKAEGLTFTLLPGGSGMGMHMTFSKMDNTTGYYAEIDEVETYSALYISFECFPISINIKPVDTPPIPAVK